MKQKCAKYLYSKTFCPWLNCNLSCMISKTTICISLKVTCSKMYICFLSPFAHPVSNDEYWLALQGLHWKNNVKIILFKSQSYVNIRQYITNTSLFLKMKHSKHPHSTIDLQFQFLWIITLFEEFPEMHFV